jgi:hypothetical protein
VAIALRQSEADEAAWWYAHREETARWMEAGRRKRPDHHAFPSVAARPPAVRRDTNGIDPDRSGRYRPCAWVGGEKGLRYQTYLKMLLHEALEREQKRMPR